MQSGLLLECGISQLKCNRAEDRIRAAKDTSLRNLPLHGFAQNQIWCELVAMACELTAWMQMLALDGPARAGNPNACACGCSPPQVVLSAAAAASGCASPQPGPWASQLTAAITRSQALAPG
jgi:hypothetical protein